MSLRLIDTTKLVWYFVVLYTGPTWSPIHCAAVKVPPKTPSTIEAQAKFFQYRHLPTSEDFDQGHRQGSERHFTERHERSRPSEGLFSAKVRWGDKKGGYGEHYWDLNHAGHNNDHDHGHGDDGSYHDNDDGSYNHNDNSDHGYDGSNDHSPTYGDDYDPEKASYEESGRAKRAYPKIKTERAERRPQREQHDEEAKPKSRKNKEQIQEAPSHKVENTEYSDEEDESSEEVTYTKPSQELYSKPKLEYRQQEEDRPQKEKKNQFVLVVKEKDRTQQALQQTANPQQQYQDFSRFVPYEGGAGVRQHHQPEITPAASVPRLFLEPTTGHVVDRATGQAYVLQPIAAPNYN